MMLACPQSVLIIFNANFRQIVEQDEIPSAEIIGFKNEADMNQFLLTHPNTTQGSPISLLGSCSNLLRADLAS